MDPRCSIVLEYLPTFGQFLGVFMYVNIPAPWFASGDGFREHVNTLNGKSRIWRACCEAESRQILPLDVHDELKQGAFPEITCLLST